MATKNRVVLTFAGDTSSLEKAADRVARSTKKMGDDFDRLNGRVAKKLPETVFTQLSNAASVALKSLPAEVQGVALAAGTAIGAVIAPAIGAAVSAGVLLAVGGGVIAAGIALAAKSPVVTRAASAFKDKLFDKDLVVEQNAIAKAEAGLEAAFARLEKARALGQDKAIKSALYDIKIAKKKLADANKGLVDAQAFNAKNMSLRDLAAPFAVPTAKALETFGQTFEKLKPDIANLFVTMAPVIDKLAPALAQMAENAMPGFVKAAEASVPLFEKLAEFMPVIGSALSVFFDEIAESGPGATTFFDHLLTAIGMTIIATGKVFSFLTQKYQEMVDRFRLLPNIFDIIGASIAAFFRKHFNNVVTVWNNTIGKIDFSLPGIGHIKGPRIPMFHQGGIVSGALGSETLAVLQAGERVTPRGGGGGGEVITLRFAGDRGLVELMKRIVKIEGGGNVQAAFGS